MTAPLPASHHSVESESIAPTLTAVPYLRVSTDDKGQNPERQIEVIAPWAEREGVVLLDAAIDEGTSASKSNPFERLAFTAPRAFLSSPTPSSESLGDNRSTCPGATRVERE